MTLEYSEAYMRGNDRILARMDETMSPAAVAPAKQMARGRGGIVCPYCKGEGHWDDGGPGNYCLTCDGSGSLDESSGCVVWDRGDECNREGCPVCPQYNRRA